MNQKTFNEVVTTTLETCKSTLTKKRDEYVTDIEKDVLSNFKNNSDLSIVGTPEGIAWELLTKHLQSIKDYCSGREVSKEVLDEKIGDSINYLLLIKGLLIERGFKSKPSQAELVEGLVDKLKHETKTDGFKHKIGDNVVTNNEVVFSGVTLAPKVTGVVVDVKTFLAGTHCLVQLNTYDQKFWINELLLDKNTQE